MKQNSEIQNLVDVDEFLKNIKQYSNEYFPELADEEYLNSLIKGNVTDEDNNLFEKEREGYLPKDPQMKFNYLEILDKDNNIFVDGEKFKCIIN